MPTITKVQKTVEVPQVEFVDQEEQVPMITKIQKSDEEPQVESVDRRVQL